MEPSRTALSTLHTVGYLVFHVAWIVAVSLLTAVALTAAGVPSLQDAADPAVLIEALGGTGIGLLTLLQIGVLAFVAWLAAGALPTDAPGEPARARSFPIGRPSAWLLGAAVVGGLTLWTLPSWIAEHLLERVDIVSTPELMMQLLQTGPLGGRLVVAFAIGVSAPICEEIIFRGYLWRAIELGWGPIAAWLGSTLLFALSHLDLVQSVSLLPVALFIGWLRLRSGSIVPAVLAHFVNNSLGLALTVVPGGDDPTPIGLPLALAGPGVTLLVAAVASRYAPRASPGVTGPRPEAPLGRSNSST